MKTTKILAIMVLAFGLIVWPAEVSEASPIGTAFTYQGRLIDANNAADGLYDFQFKLYDANVAGTQKGGILNIGEVDVIDGYFTTELDFSNVFDGNDRWLQIGVRAGELNDPNVYTILEPRQKITAMPYALYAASAPGGSGVPVPLILSGSFSQAIIDATNTGSGYGVMGKHNGTGNYGYLGSVNYGVYGLGTSSKIGVYGQNSSGTVGYLGSASYGVYGWNDTCGNYGYLGSASYGVYGQSSSSIGNGVYGYNISGNYGYLGSVNYGVYGLGTSSNIGVYGIGTGGMGVYGTSTNNIGVYGNSTISYGVYGRNDTSGNFGYLGSTSYGVYGQSSSGYAGYFSGGVYVTGNVSADSFTDRTPYPKDLATAYQAVMSMERLPDGQYNENDKENQLDHSKLSDFIRSQDGNRDLSATVSCQNEVIKDLIRQNNELNKRLEALEQKPAERMVK
jgi:hypothetical protein